MSKRYASGKRAWGECARSGRRMLLRDMVTDPYKGFLVDPAWAEPALPIETPKDLTDGIALLRPAPDRDVIPTQFDFGSAWDLTTDKSAPPLWVMVSCNPPTVAVT